MSQLDHSKRAALQASYTPVKLPREQHEVAKTQGRALEKYAFIAALKPTLPEIAELKGRLQASPAGAGDAPQPNPQLEAIRVVESALPALGTPTAFRSAPLFRGVAPDALVAFAQDLTRLRQEKVQAAIATLSTVATAAQMVAAPPATAPAAPMPQNATLQAAAPPQPPQGSPPSTVAVPPILTPQATVSSQSWWQRRRQATHPDATPQVAVSLQPQPLQAQPLSSVAAPAMPTSQAAMLPASQPPQGQPPLSVTLSPQAFTLDALVSWAARHNLAPDRALEARDVVVQMVPDASTWTIENVKLAAGAATDLQNRLIEGFKATFAVEPIGYLHLERMTFTPTGIERGELLHSVPLAPAEEINITHREWSNTSQEFERIVTDFMENYSEQGVTEKSELTEAASSQQQHSSSLDTSATVSAEYGVINHVNVNASEASHVADSASSSEQVTRNHSSTVTRKASTRVTKEHKVSFRVASAAGTEDQTVQRFVNPFPDRATRVDFYQLVRKWKVDLYRYGVRLTYDLAIPEPGSDVISKIDEINQIKDKLGRGFTFPLSPTDIARGNYLEKAASYNASLPDEVLAAPPERDAKVFPADAGGLGQRFAELELDIDERYVVDTAFLDQIPETHPHFGGDANPWFWIEGYPQISEDNANAWYSSQTAVFGQIVIPSQTYQTRKFHGQTGKQSLGYGGGFLWAARFELRVELMLKPDAYQRWQFKVWDAIRAAAQAQHDEEHQLLSDRLTRLTEEVGAQDALSLRKIEREEIMKGVLRWMLGPDLQFGPPGAGTLYNPITQTIDQASWADVLAHGEFIKFLHNAIEWENMVYFLYPYFWSHATSWELKKYLDHPDPTHKAFLRAGAARVVLTIRPGFERDFTLLLQLGSFFNALQTQGLNHPYVTIAEEMQHYAQTNYPGIQPANLVENARPLLSPKQQQAWREMAVIMSFLEVYAALHEDRYPTSLAALQSVFPLQDPWGHDYAYTPPLLQGTYSLAALGADGMPGGVGENTDIMGSEDVSTFGFATQLKAWKTVRALRALLETYAADNNGRYPARLADLPALLRPTDPWGNAYVYTFPGEHGAYDLWSYGEDTTSTRSDDKEHISSWADASLIGTWYEYTPTSAMDIAFDQILPGTFEAEGSAQ